MAVPKIVCDLVERFRLHREDYQAGAYKESQLRQEFIDPLFKALGWDIDNEQGFAEAYKDVIHEDAIKIGGATKAPDYCFRIGGTKKFFLEAKKPAVNIKEDVSPAYQLRRYAWSAKLPLSILTDFEEFAVYDCRVKPDKDDKASVARVMFFTFEELAEKWDEFASIFSREAILKGSFDKYAETNRKKRGTAEVDAAFLAEIETWRSELAKNLALRNEKLDTRDLNFAVQRIIDRIVFLRIAEDRGIEDYGRLQALLNGDNVYRRLGEMFRRADERYNSGIFHFEPEKERAEPPDELTLDLEIDDKVLKEIIKHLYYPESPYEFSVLSADILGQVYEQFLGKVISLTAGHRAKVEEKPEVKKAGGVYYTPTYIVDYIVQQTVGKLLEGKTPKQAAKLKILDPACGSGSFLIGAYQYLLDWHLKWYLENDPDNRKDIYQDHTGQARLTLARRKEILLNNIYGVDIDSQAVEVTKLSLLLKVLEGASREAIDRQLKIFHKDRALPDLGRNIKCGNSLVGMDFPTGLFDEDRRYRINVFDWRGKDGFPEIMKAGGFDAVIGNPPWVMAGYHVKDVLGYLADRYETARGKFDLYYAFVERSLKLKKQDGLLGMIVPNKFFHTKAGGELRRLLGSNERLQQLTDFGDSKLFTGATNYSCIVVVGGAPTTAVDFARSRKGLEITQRFRVKRSQLSAEPWHFQDDPTQRLFGRIETGSEPLAALTQRFGTGVQTGADKIYVLGVDGRPRIEKTLRRPLLRGRNIRRYAIAEEVREAIFPYRTVQKKFQILSEKDLKQFPIAFGYLSEHRKQLDSRVWFDKGAKELSGEWFGYMYVDSQWAFEAPHLLTPSLSDRSNFTMGSGDLFVTGTAGATSVIPRADVGFSLKYLLGVLNSTLISWYAIRHSPVFSGAFYKFSAPYLKKLPIRVPNMNDKRQRACHDKMVTFVEHVIRLNEELATAKTGHAQTVIERQIEATDRQIDQLVYELYGLTDDEIRLVEEATQ